MPVAWRIVKERYASGAVDGEGARLFGGRWNSPGVRVVYASESRALAILEILAGLRTTALLARYVLIPLEFAPALCSVVDGDALPRGWNVSPPLPSTQRIGDEWVLTGRSAVLRVPSVLVPNEFNYLFNPRHAEFRSIHVGEPGQFPLDPRLLG